LSLVEEEEVDLLVLHLIAKEEAAEVVYGEDKLYLPKLLTQ
jgi:hypothetical protein